MKTISLAVCLAALSLVSGKDVSTKPTEAPLMMSSPRPPLVPRVIASPTKAPSINAPKRRLVYRKLPEEMMETKMTDSDTSKDTVKKGMPIDMKGETLTADVRVSDMKPVQVSGFITKNGNIYEIEDKHGIGVIEGRQNSDEGSHVCNYGSIVIYSDVPCDEVTNVSVDGVPAGLKGNKPAEEKPTPQPEQPAQQPQPTQQPEQTQQPAQNAQASTENAQLSENQVSQDENDDLDEFNENENRGQSQNRRRPSRNKNSNKRRSGSGNRNRNRNRNRNGVKKNSNRRRSGSQNSNRRQKPNRRVVYQDEYDNKPTRNQNKRKKAQQQRRKQEAQRRRQQQERDELEELDEFDDDDYEEEIEQRRRRKNKSRRNQKRKNNQQYQLNDWREQEYERGRAVPSGTVLLIQEKI